MKNKSSINCGIKTYQSKITITTNRRLARSMAFAHLTSASNFDQNKGNNAKVVLIINVGGNIHKIEIGQKAMMSKKYVSKTKLTPMPKIITEFLTVKRGWVKEWKKFLIVLPLYYAPGISTINLEPLFSPSDSTRTVPLCASTI